MTYQIRIQVFITLSLMFAMTQPASAQEPYNFYQTSPKHLLESIEKQHLKLGADKQQKGEFEFAWGDFAFMLHYFPNHPVALKMIGDLSIQLEHPERAIHYFDRAVRLYPKEAPTRDLYGKFLYKIGKVNKAITQLQYAVEIDPVVAEYQYNLGLFYLEQEQYPKANQHAKAAYSKGYTLPGLKNKLEKLGYWQDEPVG